MENDYTQQAQKLSLAVNIAIESYKKHPPARMNKEQLELMVILFEETREQALNPEPEFKKTSSLNYLTQDFLREFQEGSGELVDYFWKRIGEENLPFYQMNRLTQILNSKKIKSYSEYTYVIESLSLALKMEQITQAEVDELKSLIKTYEKFHSSDIK